MDPAHRHHVRPLRSGMLLPLAILIAALTACGQPDMRTVIRVEPVSIDLPSGSPVGIATFAGGCFWCIEAHFDKVSGVISTTSGYIGGKTVNPTYKQISGRKSRHIEAVQVRFDPAKNQFLQAVNGVVAIH